MNDDKKYWSQWHPATHGSVKGWWISKGGGLSNVPAQMLLTRNGRRLITFKTLTAAQRRCDELNKPSC